MSGSSSAGTSLFLELDFPYSFFYLKQLVHSHSDHLFQQIHRLLQTYPTQTMLLSPQRIQKVREEEEEEKEEEWLLLPLFQLCCCS